jgi:hypothetical protein
MVSRIGSVGLMALITLALDDRATRHGWLGYKVRHSKMGLAKFYRAKPRGTKLRFAIKAAADDREFRLFEDKLVSPRCVFQDRFVAQ